MFKINSQIRITPILLAIVLGLIAALYTPQQGVDCAPANGGNNSNRPIRTGLLSNLFRRQTASSSSSAGATTTASSNELGTEDPQSEIEKNAQNFLNSLPSPQGEGNNGPSTFRERVSDTFGVLRDGVSNHFRSIRENFSDTVDDLRDTWGNSSSE